MKKADHIPEALTSLWAYRKFTSALSAYFAPACTGSCAQTIGHSLAMCMDGILQPCVYIPLFHMALLIHADINVICS